MGPCVLHLPPICPGVASPSIGSPSCLVKSIINGTRLCTGFVPASCDAACWFRSSMLLPSSLCILNVEKISSSDKAMPTSKPAYCCSLGSQFEHSSVWKLADVLQPLVWRFLFAPYILLSSLFARVVSLYYSFLIGDIPLCCCKKNSVALVRERTIPTERPPPVGEVSANFCG